MYCFWVGGARRYCTPFKKKICLIKQMRFSKLSHIYIWYFSQINPQNPSLHKHKSKHTHKNKHKFCRFGPFNITPVNRAYTARTCWYHWSFHLTYQYHANANMNNNMTVKSGQKTRTLTLQVMSKNKNYYFTSNVLCKSILKKIPALVKPLRWT